MVKDHGFEFLKWCDNFTIGKNRLEKVYAVVVGAAAAGTLSHRLGKKHRNWKPEGSPSSPWQELEWDGGAVSTINSSLP